jgi:FdhE protein
MKGEGGKRYLICFRCEAHWRFRRLVCPYCGKEDPEQTGLIYSDDAGYRNLSANVCSQCRSYIKTWRIEGDELDDLHPQIEDLKTPGFDQALEDEGFSRGGPNIYGVWIGSLGEADEVHD